MDDKAITALFFERAPEALTETQKKYGPLCRRIAGNILSDPRDAEEVVSDVWLRLWRTIPPERPEQRGAYAARLCRNAALDSLRARQRKKRDGRTDVLLSELDECIGGGRDPAEGLEAEELVREINKYLAGADKLSRVLFVRRYFFLDELPELAAGSGLSIRAVTGRLYRLRRGLKEHLIKKGVIV